jgi:hypothetical protein
MSHENAKPKSDETAWKPGSESRKTQKGQGLETEPTKEHDDFT